LAGDGEGGQRKKALVYSIQSGQERKWGQLVETILENREKKLKTR